MRSTKIKDINIGDNSSTFITFEAGPTHSGLEEAIKLVELAKNSGADAVKFQIFDVDRLVHDKKQLFSYKTYNPDRSGSFISIEEPIYDVLKRRCMSLSSWEKVVKKAKELKILIFATVCFIEDVVPLTKMGFDSFKIASADCDFFPLLKSVSEAKIPIQLDTGSSTIDEISKSVDYLKLNNCSDIIIHHCPSGYPAREDSIDLKMIKT